MNPAEIVERQFHPYTCRQLISLIKEMMKNKGTPVRGVGTLDGFVIHPCPKHVYAPVSTCISDCEFFSGKDADGVCQCSEGTILGFDRYTYREAVKKEEELRTDRYLKSKEPEEEPEKEEPDDW